MMKIKEQLILSLNEQQLEVLLDSGMVEFNQIKVERITCPQELLVYFYQIVVEKGKNEDVEQGVIELCRMLLNDEFRSFVNTKQSCKQQDFNYKNIESSQNQMVSTQHVYIDDSILLTHQTLLKIQSFIPFSIHLVDLNHISTFSYSHCMKLLILVEIELLQSDQQIVLTREQLVWLVKEIIMPIAFLHGWRNSGDCLFKCVQMMKLVMGYYDQVNRKRKQQQQNAVEQVREDQFTTTSLLCSAVTQFYLSKCLHSSQLNTQQIIAMLTSIQAIHSTSQTYHPNLLSSNHFISHITMMLRCSNVQSKTANSIAINIYGAILKQHNLYCSQAEIFINLYTTLRCFGAHLIKDVWSLFYDLIELQGNNIILDKSILIDIIFYKIEHHENANVVKHCIQSILQQPRSYILFTNIPDAIYNSLIRILNYGMHYLDCLFHMDSKMFSMISKFFAGFFNDSNLCKEEQIESHMRLFLKAISEKISFDHALVSLMNSFTLIVRKSHAIDEQILELITNIMKRYYIRNPIRKRHQLMNGITLLLQNHLLTRQKINQHESNNYNDNKTNNNNSYVTLPVLIEKCLIYFPQQYLVMKYNDRQTRQNIYNIIEQNFTNEEFNQTIVNYVEKIVNVLKQSHYEMNEEINEQFIRGIKSIQLVLFLSEQKTIIHSEVRCRFPALSADTVQQLSHMYGLVYERMVVDLGQSLYKSQTQRLNGIRIQRQCLQKLFSLPLFTLNFSSYQLIQKSLTNISYFIKQSISSSQNLSITQLSIPKKDLQACQFVVSRCFNMIYSLNGDSGDRQLKEKLSRVGSQFLEWAVDCVEAKQSQVLIVSVLKVRVGGKNKFEIDYIEQSVYKLFWAIFSLQYTTNPHSNQSSTYHLNLSQIISTITPLLRLRLFTLCANILFSDQLQMMNFILSIFGNLDEIADRYDFENLDQVFNLIENVFTCPNVYNNKSQTITICINKIVNIITSVIQNMLQSLNYGVDTKEVIACVNCILNIMFKFAQNQHQFNKQLVTLALKVLTIGEEYWMFERVMSFNLIIKLDKLLHSHKHINYDNLFPLLSRILCIEQYRGYDSAIAVESYLSSIQFYTQLKLTLDLDSDYEGTTCRLAMISFVNSLIQCSLNNDENHHKNVEIDDFLMRLLMYMLEQVRRDNGEKMFLTGEHKSKLKHWQCIMSYNSQWLYHKLSHSNHSLTDLILSLIHLIDLNNNLSQIKYYIELFLMKLLINSHSLEIVTPLIIDTLTEKLVELISQVNKNVSFIVIAGLLVNYLFKTYPTVCKGHVLYTHLDKLYNALLAYSCSHVAYFRGLSQYFCLQTLFIESPYTRILHQTIGQDPDTIILRDKLNVIMCDYFGEIYHWTVRNNLFKQLPTLNRNIISDTFYMDRIKKLGQELLRQVKGQVGFLPYKDIWIEAVKTLKLADENTDLNKERQKQPTQQAIFQRKIDPSLDFIYFSKTKLQGFEMKILITGAKKIPIYGHLSRTGEIFGLSQLIIPYKEIIEDEEFKNVACTAQKWLNISEFSNQRQIKNKEKFLLSLQKKLLKIKQEGYLFFLLKKHENTSIQLLKKQISDIQCHKRILLILDSQNNLPRQIYKLLTGVICFGEHFSEHVEASIFIWQYFKECYGEKFRTSSIQID